jgi:hypothetical protein
LIPQGTPYTYESKNESPIAILEIICTSTNEKLFVTTERTDRQPDMGGEEPDIGGEEPGIGGEEPDIGGEEPD